MGGSYWENSTSSKGMEDISHITAIQQLAEDAGLYIDKVCDSSDPNRISVLLALATGDATIRVEHCDFDKKLVIEWIKNGELEGKQHMAAQIKKSSDLLREYYRGTG
jgi:hypothetical protein